MTQGRMHPDDLRAIMAAQLALSSDDLTTGDVARGIEGADAIIAELTRTAKPEATSEWPKEALDRIEAWTSSCEFHINRAEKAEARVKEMDNRLVIAESWRNDAALGLGEKRNKRIAELEQWQWDNMKKWLGIIGWGSMTPTQPECPTLIDAALQQGVEDAKRVDTLEARVKELEDAIRDHRNVHSKMPCPTRYEYGIWAKVNP